MQNTNVQNQKNLVLYEFLCEKCMHKMFQFLFDTVNLQVSKWVLALVANDDIQGTFILVDCFFRLEDY